MPIFKSILKNQSLHAALSFLTILVKGKSYDTETLQKSLAWFPVVGALVFFLSAVFALLFLFFTKNSFLSALIFLLADCLVIRGLHHDGLADIADAFGSGKTGSAFREVLKDSRIGSFGILALIFYFLFSLICLTQVIDFHFAQESYFVFFLQMIFLGTWSRLGLLALPCVCPLYQANTTFSLSQSLFADFRKNIALFWYVGLLFFACLFLNISLILLTSVFSLLFSYPLYRIAKKETGYNGDFLGANCLLWEIAGYLSLAIFCAG